MKVKVLVYCALVISQLSCHTFASPKNETQGQVADAGGLLKVQTVCLDTSALSKRQSGLLKRVVNRARKPKGVLSKLNWQLLDACDGAEAVVNLDIRDREKESWDDAHAPGGGEVGPSLVTRCSGQDARHQPRLGQEALPGGGQASTASLVLGT